MRRALPILLLIAGCAADPASTPSTSQAPATATRPVPADALEFRCPAAGVVRRIGDATATYEGADPSDPRICRARFSNNSQATGLLWNFWIVPAPDAERWAAVNADLWPAVPGKVAERTVNSQPPGALDPTFVRERWVVRGIESITIPAGTFQALVFDRTQQGQGNNSFEGSWRYYHDVETRVLIKTVYTHTRGRPPQNPNWEATALVVPR